MLPVLSNTTKLFLPIFLSTSLERSKLPFSAPIQISTIKASGAARVPIALEQAVADTATQLINSHLFS